MTPVIEKLPVPLEHMRQIRRESVLQITCIRQEIIQKHEYQNSFQTALSLCEKNFGRPDRCILIARLLYVRRRVQFTLQKQAAWLRANGYTALTAIN